MILLNNIAHKITIKNNIKTWLNQYRMINDTVDILDPFIINLGLEFVIKADRSVRYESVDTVLEQLRLNGAKRIGLLTERKAGGGVQ